MKWKVKSAPKEGEIRNKKKFCLFPTTIKGWTYWLEFITIKQKYYQHKSVSGYTYPRWENIQVIENEKRK